MTNAEPHPTVERSPARILLADDHPLMRQGMRAMLEREPGVEIVAEAQNGRQVVELSRSLKPDLVLMDVRMPEMDSLQATQTIKQELPQISVLIVTSHEDPTTSSRRSRQVAPAMTQKRPARRS